MNSGCPFTDESWNSERKKALPHVQIHIAEPKIRPQFTSIMKFVFGVRPALVCVLYLLLTDP